MVTSVRSDFGMGLGKVVVDEETKRPKISQKVAGIDIEEYITAYKDAKKVQQKPYQDKIDNNTKTLAALSTFQNKLKSVQDVARTMANRVSGTYDSSIVNAFNQRAVEASANDGTDYTKIVKIGAFTGAKTGSFSVQVNHLAKSDMVKGTIETTGINTQLGYSGSFSIGATSGTIGTITLTPDMSLDDIQLAINNASTDTKVNADISLVSIGATSTYELKLKAQITGEPITLKNTSGTPLTSLKISQATTNKICGIFSTTNEATALNLSGDLTIGAASGTAQTITLDPTWTLSQLVAKINLLTPTTNVTASYDLAFYSTPSKYQIKLESTDASTVTIGDTAGALSALGLDVPVTDFNDLCSNLTVDGTLYKKRSNTINDIIDNVRLDLRSVSAATVYGTVVDDTNAFADQFNAFMDAYNDMISFYNTQTKAKVNADGSLTGGAAEGADLYGNNYVRDCISKLKTSLSGGVPGASAFTAPSYNGGSTVSTLTSMGVNVQADGTIKITDSKAFFSAVDNKYSDIKELFANSVSFSDSDYALIGMPTKLPPDVGGKPVTVSISTDASGNTTAKFNLGGTDYAADVVVDGMGIKVTGKDGLFAGISVLFRGSLANGASTSATVTMTQGRIAELDSQILGMIDETVDTKTNKKKGSVFAEIELLTKNNESQKKIVDKIDADTKKEASRLEKEFMKVYEATFELESIMGMIDAFNKAN